MLSFWIERTSGLIHDASPDWPVLRAQVSGGHTTGGRAERISKRHFIEALAPVHWMLFCSASLVVARAKYPSKDKSHAQSD